MEAADGTDLARQGNDFFATGTDDRRAEHLMMVGDLVIAMAFFQAPRAMDLVGREILGAVESHQVIAIQKAKVLQSPVAL